MFRALTINNLNFCVDAAPGKPEAIAAKDMGPVSE